MLVGWPPRPSCIGLDGHYQPNAMRRRDLKNTTAEAAILQATKMLRDRTGLETRPTVPLQKKSPAVASNSRALLSISSTFDRLQNRPDLAEELFVRRILLQDASQLFHALDGAQGQQAATQHRHTFQSFG